MLCLHGFSKPLKSVGKIKDFIVLKKPLEEEVVRDPVQVGRRTKETLGKSMVSLLWHMLPSYLRWRVIWFYMVSGNLGKP